jgi:regulator of RNase E activity RraA
MPLDLALLDRLAGVDTPTICNALEIVAPERQHHGYTIRPFFCVFPAQKPIVGLARTARIQARFRATRTVEEMKVFHRRYYEYVGAGDGLPTIVVVQDIDPQPGYGSFWGEVNTAIHKGLGVRGCITNGSVRDLDVIAEGFQILSAGPVPSHAFVHVEAIDVPVEVHGMSVSPSDLIHADRHGAVVIPADLASRLPDAIDLCLRREAPLLAAARAPGFTVEKLQQAIGESGQIH